MLVQDRFWAVAVSISFLTLVSSGCSSLNPIQGQDSSTGQNEQPTLAAVDVATAQRDAVAENLEYIGTTQPGREISLRSQVEGQLLSLTVEVGDRVIAGQLLVQLDAGVLQAAVSQAQAELATQQAEVVRAQGEVTEAKTQVEIARVQLQQAQIEAERSQLLFSEGAVAKQQVELTQTQLRTTQQTLASERSQILVRQAAVKAAQGRVDAQRALIAQEQERLSYTRLTSPINGFVLQRVSEPGNLVQPGSEILRLGDFSRVKVLAQVSELELDKIRLGQSVKVRLDAFPNESFTGQVNTISPAADPTARQVPVEVILANPESRIGSGLLARVSFTQGENRPVVVPQTALEASEQPATLFVLSGSRDRPTVTARTVRLGEKRDGNIEILSGLAVGERFVARSSRPLKNGESVRLSFLSKQSETLGEGERVRGNL